MRQSLVLIRQNGPGKLLLMKGALKAQVPLLNQTFILQLQLLAPTILAAQLHLSVFLYKPPRQTSFYRQSPESGHARNNEYHFLELSWLRQCQGSPSLKDLISVYKPDIVILIETLVDSNKISDLCYILGFKNHFIVDRIGRSEGLAILWRNNINCPLLNYS